MANSHSSTNSNGAWTSSQAYIFAIICLVIGVAVGYFVRGSGSAVDPHAGHNHGPETAGTGSTQVTPEQLRHMADTQAKPVLEQLKNAPNDPTLLAQAGNIYYDAQIFQQAVEYYKKSLAIKPNDSNVRTDLGTAIWHLGDADGAIAEFNKALQSEPDKAPALFNMGLVKWQGKMDIPGAIADWEKLLKVHPEYQDRSQVEQLLAQVKQHANIAPGTKSTKPIQ